MQSKFTIYGANIIEQSDGILAFLCTGILVSFDTESVFIYRSTYIAGKEPVTYVDDGIGISVIPDIPDTMSVCRNLLNSSEFEPQVEPIPIERVVGFLETLKHAEGTAASIPQICLPNLQARFPTTGGTISVERYKHGSLHVKIHPHAL
jgi:hypothetical protein